MNKYQIQKHKSYRSQRRVLIISAKVGLLREDSNGEN
jgi:hypothetical protein